MMCTRFWRYEIGCDTFLPYIHGGKVDLSGHIYGEMFLGYEIFHGRVSLDDKLHAVGVTSLATSSSMVAGLLQRQAQLDLHSTVGYVVVCDMDFAMLQHVF